MVGLSRGLKLPRNMLECGHVRKRTTLNALESGSGVERFAGTLGGRKCSKIVCSCPRSGAGRCIMFRPGRVGSIASGVKAFSNGGPSVHCSVPRDRSGLLSECRGNRVDQSRCVRRLGRG